MTRPEAGDSFWTDHQIGHGQHSVVWREASGIVRKEYLDPDPERALTQARREHHHLARLSAALGDRDDIRCPHPVDVIEGDPPAVRMSWCAGRRLDVELLARRIDLPELERIGAQVADLGWAFMNTFGSPHEDFTLMNLLYDAPGGVVTLIDFTVPEVFAGRLPGHARGMTDVALGALVGSAAYTAARPAAVRSPWRPQLASFARAVVAAWRQRGPVERTGVEEVAWTFYGLALTSGPLHRRVWYRGPGRLLAWRVLRQALGAQR